MAVRFFTLNSPQSNTESHGGQIYHLDENKINSVELRVLRGAKKKHKL